MNDAGAAAPTESTVYGILKLHDLLGPACPGSFDEAFRVIGDFVDHYTVRQISSFY